MIDARWICCWLIFFIFCAGFQVYAIQAENDFVAFFSQAVDDFFYGFELCRVSFLAFENSSFLKGDQLARFYQLFAAVLEKKKGIKFIDNLIEMKDQKGLFDFSGKQTIDYLIALKFIQDGRKLGLGLQIYSRRDYSLVYFRYFAGELSPAELEMLTFQPEISFETDFFLIQNLTIFEDFLDILYWEGRNNQLVFVLFANRIEVYRWKQEQLKKETELSFKFEKIFKPAQISEGELSYFQNQNESFLAAGFNFYPDIFLFKIGPEGELVYSGLIEALPFATINLGGENYLLAKKYDMGKNFFTPKIYLLDAQLKIVQFKELEPFYALYLIEEKDSDNKRIYILNCQRQLKVFNHLFQPLFEQAFPGATYFASDGQKFGFLQVSEADGEYLQQILLLTTQMKIISRLKLSGEVQLMRYGWLGSRGIFLVLNVNQKRIVQFWKLKNEKD